MLPIFFFFKQKTAYEMDGRLEFRRVLFRSRDRHLRVGGLEHRLGDHGQLRAVGHEIGRASCRERGEISGGAGSLKKKKEKEKGRGGGADTDEGGRDAQRRRGGGREGRGAAW